MRVVVGRIGRAHGIRGEVSVDVRTDEPEARFAPGSVLLPVGRAGSLVVEAARWHSGRLLVAFEGVPDRTAAEALRGLVLEAEVDEAEVPEDPEEFYDRQLVGLAAVLLDGTPLGQVAEVVHLPGHELLAITPVADGTEGAGARELLVPFVAAIVPRVDLETGVVVVDPPPGLLGDLPEDAVPDDGA